MWPAEQRRAQGIGHRSVVDSRRIIVEDSAVHLLAYAHELSQLCPQPRPFGAPQSCRVLTAFFAGRSAPNALKNPVNTIPPTPAGRATSSYRSARGWTRRRSAVAWGAQAAAVWLALGLAALPQTASAQPNKKRASLQKNGNTPVKQPAAKAAKEADAEQAPLNLELGDQMVEEVPVEIKPRLPVFVYGDRMQGQVDGEAVLEGNAEFRRHDTVIKSDRLQYDQRTGDAKAKGNVVINRSGDRFEGPELELNVNTDVGQFQSPNYSILKNDARGESSRVDFLSKDRLIAHDANYSTCPRVPGQQWMPAWLVRASSIEIDQAEDVGTAKGGVLEFQGLPILAAPYLTFPLSDRRKTGALPPSLSLDNVSGLQVTTPYYFNIAPDFDATVTPTVMTRRGLELDNEFRYLQPSYTGQLRGVYLPSDRLRDIDRWLYSAQHSQRFGPVGLRLNLNRVSDDNYWKDFPRGGTSITRRLFANDVSLSTGVGPWSLSVGANKWQTLQNEGSIITPPYDRLPTASLNFGQENQELLGLNGWDYSVKTSATRFQRSVLVDDSSKKVGGDRGLVVADITRRWQAPGWFVQPKLRLNAAQYRYDNTAGVATTGSRSIPTVSLDSGLIFERSSSFFNSDYVQTLEPRAFFTWTPFRDQSELPNFDSAARDFNLATSFAENAFSGNDRVTDTRAVTLGLSSRFLNPGSGAEVLRLGVAQRYYLADQNVTLSGGAPITERASDVLLGARVKVDPVWSLDSNVQYNPKTKASARATVGTRYTPGPYRVLSTAYRIQRGVTEQLDLGWQWPLGSIFGATPSKVQGRALGPGKWYSVGRLNYSLPDRKVVDLVAGFEYDAGCWLGRVVGQRLQTSTTEANQSILFQLEFSGFSRVGASSLQSLQANVPKYQYLREEIVPDSRYENYD